MTLIDVMTAPWAIEPKAFHTIVSVVNRHLAGQEADLSAISARLGRELKNERREMQIIGSTAVIEISGPIARGMNLLSDVSGGTSTQVVAHQIEDALANPAVANIVLSIDSPGGQVAGVQELADQIFSARAKKQIVAVANGTMASAAYWIGSAAARVYLASSTDVAGSIGVVTTHVDYSGREAQLGVKVSEISAGKYKRITSEHAPLSEDGRAELQAHVDYIYSVFVDTVARNRGTSADAVLKQMADGRIFVGQQAVAAGLVDGIKTLPMVLAELSAAGTGIARGLGGSTNLQAARVREATLPASPDLVPAASSLSRQPGASLDVAAAAMAKRKELKELGLAISEAEALQLVRESAPSVSDPTSIALHAKAHQAQQRAMGRKISTSEAVDHVMSCGSNKRASDPAHVASQAQDYIAEQAKLGRNVSTAAAVDHVMRTLGLVNNGS